VSDEGSGPGGESTAGAEVWRRSASAAYVGSDDRVVVLDLEHLDLQPYVFEGSAAQVWACLDGERTESEIVDDLAEAYAEPRDVVLDGVREFLGRLRGLGLIVRGTDG
jgi:Coenzyme PQQ synthesis protein D (PqqD)